MMNSRIFRNIALATGLLLSAPTLAAAADVVVNRDWEGHKAADVCYAITFPQKQGDRESYLTVSNFKDQKSKDEVGFISGFGEDANIQASVTVDGNLPMKLLVYKGTGYVKSMNGEDKLISQMKAGTRLEVKWTKESGDYVVDSYSLLGFTKTHGFIVNCK